MFVLCGLGSGLADPFWNSRLNRLFFAKDTVNGGPADAVGLGDLAQALPVLVIEPDSVAIQFQRSASDVATFEAGAPHAGFHSFDDQVSFQLRNRADDDHDGAAQRTAGVDLLAEADELDVEPVQFVQHLEEVLHGTGDPVGRPDQDHIEAAVAGIPHQFVQPWPARLHATDPVGVFLHDFIAALGSQLFQVEELSFRMLVDGADSHVEGGALHGFKDSTHI